MARRVSRRKEPSRDVYTLKEQRKIDTGIFDERTMIYLSKFFNKGIIKGLKFIIAKGKEADVYLAEAGESNLVKDAKFVVIKFFRVETTSFLKMSDYVTGDPRFSKIRIAKNSIINIWCKKEMGNLKIANGANVYSPKPYMANGSILAMQFIGNEEGVSSPQLKYIVLSDPANFLKLIIDQIKELYKNGLVHADLSEYNILVHEGKPFFIDFGQAVVLRHPNALSFLDRDVRNVLNYFKKRYYIDKDVQEALDYVKKK